MSNPNTEARRLARVTTAVRRAVPRLGTVLRVGCSLALLLFLFQRTSLPEVLSLLRETIHHWPLLIVATILPGIGSLIAALRWRVLLASVGARPLVRQLLAAVLVGTFFNQFFPSTIGGDVVRGWRLGEAVGSTGRSLTVVGLERVIGLLGLCTVGAIAMLLHPPFVHELPQLWVVLAVVALGAVGTGLLAHPRSATAGRQLFSIPVLQPLRGTASMVYRTLSSLGDNKLRVLTALLMSMALQLTIICQYLLLSVALNLEISLLALAGLIPIVTLVTLLPLSINGIGLRESSLAVLGASFGLGAADAIALAWLFVFFGFLYAAAGGVVYLFGRPRG